MSEERLIGDATRLGPSFERALRIAIKWHGDQPRKGSITIPYISHLLGVASLVLEDGGSEKEAMAGLLHDALEDTRLTTKKLARELGGKTGKRVAKIVYECSDGVDERGRTKKHRGPGSWLSRKRAYLHHLERATKSALRVSAADKLHNARAQLRDVRSDPIAAWAKFNAPPSEAIWYYHSLVAVFSARLPGSFLTAELAATVDELVIRTDVAAASAAYGTV